MELRPLAAPFPPRLQGAVDQFDCGNDTVNDFLRNAAELVARSRLGTTLVLLDSHEINGYMALGFSQVLLTNREKGGYKDLRHAFGAIRIGMIGIDQRAQSKGYGSLLLDAAVGLAREVSHHLAVRYLVADANLDHVNWYARHGWLENRAARERKRLEDTSLVSMRFDLIPA